MLKTWAWTCKTTAHREIPLIRRGNFSGNQLYSAAAAHLTRIRHEPMRYSVDRSSSLIREDYGNFRAMMTLSVSPLLGRARLLLSIDSEGQ
jgi:hypothetical protein